MIEELRAHVAARLGPLRMEEVDHAIDVTLEGLGASLPRAERYGVLEALPTPLHERMSRSPPEQAVTLAALIGDVARPHRLSIGRATEEVEAVCEALADLLDADALDRLRRHLPPELAARLEPPPARSASPLDHPHRRSDDARTLAEGRPGSRHPI
jgi:uncharacterized protein (DUF2267 family)